MIIYRNLLRCALLLTTISSIAGPAAHAGPKNGVVELPPDPRFTGDTILSMTDTAGRRHQTWLMPELQRPLESWIRKRLNPISSLVAVDVTTGRILALVQGSPPARWGGANHTALHTGFPAASLFKTVVTATAFEVAGLDPAEPIGLVGGCADVHASGQWMRRDARTGPWHMTLRRAYGQSCNGFFAKITVNRIGFGPVLQMARRFGWNDEPVPADISTPSNPISAPNPATSSVHTIGRFAAGFGYVGTSAVHTAWNTTAIARDGQAISLSLIRPPAGQPEALPETRNIIKRETAIKIRKIMDTTVRGGTASFAFRRNPHRRLRPLVGGKTGTLSGRHPDGITTWFAGMMPLDEPEIVVVAVAMVEDFWKFKAAHLAAETFWLWQRHKKKLARATPAAAGSYKTPPRARKKGG